MVIMQGCEQSEILDQLKFPFQRSPVKRSSNRYVLLLINLHTVVIDYGDLRPCDLRIRAECRTNHATSLNRKLKKDA